MNQVELALAVLAARMGEKEKTLFNRSGVGIDTRKKRSASQRRRKNKQRKQARAMNRKRGQKMK